jgi:hypothetical protein
VCLTEENSIGFDTFEVLFLTDKNDDHGVGIFQAVNNSSESATPPMMENFKG